MPALLTKINNDTENTRKKIIENRLLDGINRYNTLEDGLNQNYETTYDFLIGLSKYYKMSTICKSDDIKNCIPYDKIYYGEENKNLDVSTLTTIESFLPSKYSQNYLPPASFINAQGIPFIITLKKGCF